MSLLKSLQARWDVVTGRFAAFRITTAEERRAAEAVLVEVRGRELNRIVRGDPWASPAFGDTAPATRDYAVRDRRTGEVVGVVQLAAARDLAAVPSTVDAYALDRLGELVDRTAVVVFFALLPAYRGTPAGLALLAEAAREGIADGVSASVFVAEPAIVGRYAQLGARPLAPMRASAYGGYRLPMYLLTGDRAWLDQVGSPLRVVLRDVPADEVALRWQRTFEDTFGRIDSGVSCYDPDAWEGESPSHALLTRGMTTEETAACLDGSLLLAADPGDRVLAAGDGGRLLGVVHEGLAHVVVRGRVVAALGRGEPFGEMAFVTGDPRTADLVAAAPGTRLLQLSPGALARLPAPAAATLWKNVAWCLAQRLAATTRQIA